MFEVCFRSVLLKNNYHQYALYKTLKKTSVMKKNKKGL